MRYELYYWPSIQGRGEFVRLALEAAGADYLDIARGAKKDGAGVPAMLRLMDGSRVPRPPFAPPFLKAGAQVIGQTANILFYLGPRLGLAPAGEAGRLWTNQLQLTLADFLVEAHDTHHPIGAGLHYEEQETESKRRAADFVANRLTKYLDYFETVLEANGSGGNYLVGARLSYADLSLFQLTAGLRYAFPRAMKRREKDYPRVMALHDAVAARPRVRDYLTSERRIPFNEMGIFRHYPALDK